MGGYVLRRRWLSWRGLMARFWGAGWLRWRACLLLQLCGSNPDFYFSKIINGRQSTGKLNTFQPAKIGKKTYSYTDRPVHVQRTVPCTMHGEPNERSNPSSITHTDYRFLDFFNKPQLGNKISTKKIYLKHCAV